MTFSSKDSFLLLEFTLAMGLLLAGEVGAQTLTIIHNFSSGEGAVPYSEPIILSNKLYGTTTAGGTADTGTVFVMGEDGAGFRTLHSFGSLSATTKTNLDGANPKCRLIVSNLSLYGTTEHGGRRGKGTIFKVNLDGSAFVVLHHFSGGPSEGEYPWGGLVRSGSTLYGTTFGGGTYFGGTVFAMSVDGTGFTNLYHFATMSAFGGDPRGGYNPSGSLVLLDNSLYGTTTYGGVDLDGNLTQNGTVFGLIDRTSFTVLYTFTPTSGPPFYTNSDGVNPNGSLVASGRTLYGTTYQGGLGNSGTVFAVGTDGSGLRALYSFSPLSNSTNRDGAYPLSGLTLFNNTLYGTTVWGGTVGGFGGGTVFCLGTDGTGFQSLHSFAGFPMDGSGVYAGLSLSGSTLFGATSIGATGPGSIFKISLQPRLTPHNLAGNMVITWPATVAGFDYTSSRLQSTTNLASGSWTADLPGPEIINQHCTVSIPITGGQRFIRLRQ